MCRVEDAPGDGDEVAERVAAVLVDDGVPEPVAALAMVRPRARLAPSAPVPTAVPMSGRVILTVFSFVPPGARTMPGRGGPWCPRRSVSQAELASGWGAALSQR